MRDETITEHLAGVAPATAADRPGINRRRVLAGGAVGAAAVWSAPTILHFDAAGAQGSPAPGGEQARLRVDKTGPQAVFRNQTFDFLITVFNDGPVHALSVQLNDTLPTEGTFVSSTPAGTVSGGILTINLGNLPAGSSTPVTVRWTAPDAETTLLNAANAKGDNTNEAFDGHSVSVGTATQQRAAGVAAAGTALRNRSGGTITLAGIPAGATVDRAVLIWAVLYQGAPPPGTVVLAGTPVTANLTQTTSNHVCWGDDATRGFAADVTGLVAGNGTYRVTGHPLAAARVDSEPAPAGFPQTDGASLIVFYSLPSAGAGKQVLSDFTYDAWNGGSPITRSFAGLTPSGTGASLLLAGPDGQNNAAEVTTITAAGSLTFNNLFNGSDPIDAPNLSIGNLWDTDQVDVTSILPSGTTTLQVKTEFADCVGIGAAILVVDV
ncbi:MAG TPA: hypothetical protein VNB94_04330 [Mycobacteriales bacterium]|nr:hypothetical protein [Mycobacteriales bacterium]